VIVTGASSGIGGSTARLMHAAGAHPVLAARRAGRVAALSEELNGALAVPTGVTDLVQVRDLVAAALGPHQRIDGLVNNAGASLHAPARPGRPCRVRTGPAAQPRPAIRR
jgi:NADP-dependent 3-hydroxy acid dehydrogenase YdfG